MSKDRPVRLISKRKQQAVAEAHNEGATSARPKPTDREIKNVVSSWVRDHRQRSEEFRRNFASLVKVGGLRLPARG